METVLFKTRWLYIQQNISSSRVLWRRTEEHLRGFSRETWWIDLVSDELDEMFPNKVLWSVVCGTLSGIIAAWLVVKFLQSKGRDRRERKRRSEKWKTNGIILTTLQINCVKKRIRDSTRGLENTRRCIIKVGVQIFTSFEMLPSSLGRRQHYTLLKPWEACDVARQCFSSCFI